jgi:hypothetical protein
MAYFGTQFNSSDSPRIDLHIHKFFDAADAPASAECATYVDHSGTRTFLSSGYWTDPAHPQTGLLPYFPSIDAQAELT